MFRNYDTDNNKDTITFHNIKINAKDDLKTSEIRDGQYKYIFKL